MFLCNICTTHVLDFDFFPWFIRKILNLRGNCWCHLVLSGGGALPYVGGYQVPVKRPLFYADPTPKDLLFFIQSTPSDPLFFHFCVKFYIKIANFSALRAHFEKNSGNFNRKFANFALKFHFSTLNDPHFWESTSKKPPCFWCPHWMTPFFWRNVTPNAPYFRSPVGTSTLLSYLRPPPGVLWNVRIMWHPNSGQYCLWNVQYFAKVYLLTNKYSWWINIFSIS